MYLIDYIVYGYDFWYEIQMCKEMHETYENILPLATGLSNIEDTSMFHTILGNFWYIIDMEAEVMPSIVLMTRSVNVLEMSRSFGSRGQCDTNERK